MFWLASLTSSLRVSRDFSAIANLLAKARHWKERKESKQLPSPGGIYAHQAHFTDLFLKAAKKKKGEIFLWVMGMLEDSAKGKYTVWESDSLIPETLTQHQQHPCCYDTERGWLTLQLVTIRQDVTETSVSIQIKPHRNAKNIRCHFPKKKSKTWL